MRIISNGNIQHNTWFTWCGLKNKNTWKTHAYNFIIFLIMAYVVKFTLLFAFYFIQIHLWSFQVCGIKCLIASIGLFILFFCLGHLPFFTQFQSILFFLSTQSDKKIVQSMLQI
jgi:hypothetical protein